MRSHFFKIMGTLLLVAGITLPAFADSGPTSLGQDKAQSREFYQDTKRGWFWYEKTPEPIKKKKPEPAEPQALAPAPAENKTAKDFTYEELWTMAPPEFQKVYTNTLNKAVQTLAVDDTEAFYQAQDIARRKAAGFANVAAYVVQTNPQYNVIKDYPVATPGRRARLVNQDEEISSVIQKVRGNHALLFFYSTTCRYCAEEAEILQMFTQKYGWEIKGIDINREPDLARRFQITTTPTLFMVQQDNPTPFPVAVGVISLNELESNLVSGVRMLASGEQKAPVEYSVYDFQKGSSFDPEAELRRARENKR